jgi:LysR family carnitine catabolism transcriptional activator
VRSKAALEREMLADFIGEIARECATVGEIIDNRLEDLPGAA